MVDGWFLWFFVGKYTSPMESMSCFLSFWTNVQVQRLSQCLIEEIQSRTVGDLNDRFPLVVSWNLWQKKISRVNLECTLILESSRLLNVVTQYYTYMGVSLNGGTPISHPKMIIFSRKTDGCWVLVPQFKETPIYKVYSWVKFFDGENLPLICG